MKIYLTHLFYMYLTYKRAMRRKKKAPYALKNILYIYKATIGI